MSLYDQLNEILAREGVLPDSPDDAVGGTVLLERVQPLLMGTYSENSIRQTFSYLAANPTSPMARIEQGYGYYRRPAAIADITSDKSIPSAASTPAPPSPTSLVTPTPTEGRDGQAEEKFRAFYLRYVRLNSGFPVHIEHTASAHRPGGVNKWKFPDVVALEWEVGEQREDGFVLDRAMLEVKRGLGEQPFRLSSVELKVALALGNFREFFFQCVSNSKWAHHAQLAVATPISDALLATELRRLGASYEVSVLHFNFSREQLDALPLASAITTLSDADFEALAVAHPATPLTTSRSRPALDWDHIRDMRTQNSDFREMFDWIARCLHDARAYTFSHYRQLRQIEQEAG